MKHNRVPTHKVSSQLEFGVLPLEVANNHPRSAGPAAAARGLEPQQPLSLWHVAARTITRALIALSVRPHDRVCHEPRICFGKCGIFGMEFQRLVLTSSAMFITLFFG